MVYGHAERQAAAVPARRAVLVGDGALALTLAVALLTAADRAGPARLPRHYLSMISVQSGVALNLNHDLPNQVRDSPVAVRQASKEGLAEFRRVPGQGHRAG